MMLMSAVIVLATLSAEMFVMFIGPPPTASEILVGRVLGTLDAALMLVLNYHYSSSAGSDRKTTLMAAQDKTPAPGAGAGA